MLLLTLFRNSGSVILTNQIVRDFFVTRVIIHIWVGHLCCLLIVNIVFNFQSGLQPKYLLRFAVSDGGLIFVDGKLEKADLQYLGKANRARAFADSYSKVSR